MDKKLFYLWVIKTNFKNVLMYLFVNRVSEESDQVTSSHSMRTGCVCFRRALVTLRGVWYSWKIPAQITAEKFKSTYNLQTDEWIKLLIKHVKLKCMFDWSHPHWMHSTCILKNVYNMNWCMHDWERERQWINWWTNESVKQC